MELKKLKWENPELFALSKTANGNASGYICRPGSGAIEECYDGGQVIIFDECYDGGQATSICELGSALVD